MNIRPVNLLLVEDDEDAREALFLSLELEGFAVTARSTADAACDDLEHGTFDALVTDIQLPGRLNGLALAERAHRLHPRMPVIFMTARRDLLRRRLTARETLIPKPLGADDVLGALQRELGLAGVLKH